MIPDEYVKNTMLETLGIDVVELSENRAVATMPVDNNTRQPMGILHGGASAVLAESVASLGAWNLINKETHYVVGLEINANHLRGKKEGMVKALGTPVHRGRTTQVWEIKIVDETDKLICISRCTIAVREKEA
ncbi:uncharacterized domain 1-containing protein [Alteribacillus persepolensis]|uniref:Uncharacterized domain 1-containing protein n=1 Tax=Alteribacillus persepolensis TaxID=568899 RepID=A0A1G8FNV1_9BACI|nr:hotdog fold thioesterase [Alteribacillus persepolensis]SDH83853.1 uncharacterized domain 1-containing protein [Alteribacillus persepolensis]